MFKASNKTRSVPAFSMMEAIIGMAITAIVMGLIFVIFAIISERMLDYKNQNQLVADMNRLTYSLNKDLFESEQMNAAENGIDFKGYSGTAVNYRFFEAYILRNSETFTDTFRIKLKQVRIDSVQNKSRKVVFQKLALGTEINEKEMNLKFYKRVYANELLKAIKQP